MGLDSRIDYGVGGDADLDVGEDAFHVDVELVVRDLGLGVVEGDVAQDGVDLLALGGYPVAEAFAVGEEDVDDRALDDRAGGVLRRFGYGGRLVEAVGEVGREGDEVAVRLGGVERLESLLELGVGEPALAGGVAQDVGDVLALGVGDAAAQRGIHRRGGGVLRAVLLGSFILGHEPNFTLATGRPRSETSPSKP